MTESESEESECFHILSTPLVSVIYDLVKTRLLKSEAEAGE